MPETILSRPSKTTFRWRVEWKGADGHSSATAYFTRRWVAIFEAHFRVLSTEGWRGEVILFDQSKGE